MANIIISCGLNFPKKEITTAIEQIDQADYKELAFNTDYGIKRKLNFPT